MNKVINEIKKYGVNEQLILLLSRTDYNEELNKYIQDLIQKENINSEFFTGIVYINRLNGMIYNNIKKINKISTKIILPLKLSYLAQKERTKKHQEEIDIIYNSFEKAKIKYSFLKGSVLNTLFYSPGERISNDTDIMVAPSDLNKCTEVLEGLGYIQGNISDGKIIPATKKEKVFARLNTYEIVPFIKPTDSEYLPFHEVDINFKLSNNEETGNSNIILEESLILKYGDKSIRTMSVENFLIYLCIHLYREATMVFKIVQGDDLTLYKFMDIHVFISKKSKEINWAKMYDNGKKLNKIRDIYYTLYFTEQLYPETISSDILEMFNPGNSDYLDEYRGKDNSNEVYKWKTSFKDRVFNNMRKFEALENIEKESDRFNEIQNKLKEK